MLVRRPAACATLAALALVALPASAQDNASFYLGATLGVAKSSMDPTVEEHRLGGLGLSNPVVSTDERGHAVKAFVGRTLLPNLAVEGGIFSLRAFELRSSVTGGTARTENYVYGYHLDAVAGWPVTETLRAYGRAGILNAHAKTEYDRSGTVPAGPLESKSVKLGWKLGLGVEYRLTDEFSLRAEWERYRVPNGTGTRDNIDALSVGLLFRF